MITTWQAIIDRARTYVDDDHAETDGWLSPAKWLLLAQVEYEQLYSKWVRMGVIVPMYVDQTWTGSTVSPDAEILTILGVVEVYSDGSIRHLAPSQEKYGRAPIRHDVSAPATHWEAYDASGMGDLLTINTFPQDETANYLVRYLACPARTTDPTTAVSFPFGLDERVVLGTARRASAKESASSSLVNGLITQCDEHAAFVAASRGAALKVRRVRSTPKAIFSSDPSTWTFLR